jgi:putative ABC transport system permease protein
MRQRSRDRSRRALLESLYKAALRLLPARFRERYGQEMLQTFREASRNAAETSGWLGVLQVRSRMLAELLLRAPLEHLSRESRPARLVRLNGGRSWIVRTAEAGWSDVRLALRGLRKSPGFASVAVVTLALGIGANSAIFSVVNGVLLRPLPYPDSDRLAAVWLEFVNQENGLSREIPASEPEYLEFRDQSTVFSDVAGYYTSQVNLGGLEEPERVWAAAVSANFLDVLRVAPLLGRGYAEGEDHPDADRMVLLAYPLWLRAFGANPDVVGTTAIVNGVTRTIIGVLPPDFRFPGRDIDIVTQNFVDPLNPGGRSSHYISMFGRLRDGVSWDRARIETAELVERWSTEFPDRHGPSERHPIVFTSLHERLVGDVRPAVLVLLGTVALVLLIACANLANLMLARSETRQRDVSVRTALGASRTRLISHVMSESVIVAALAAVLGLGLAIYGVRALALIGPANMPRMDAIQIDGTVVGFTATIALATVMIFGIGPALAVSRIDVHIMFKEASSAVTSHGRRLTFRAALIVVQVSLAVVLVVGAGLLLKSFSKLVSVDPGFSTDGVVTLEFALDGAYYQSSEDVARFHRELDQRVQALPGVVAVGAIRSLPLWRVPGWETMRLSGLEVVDEDGPLGNAQYQIASPGYFAALRIPLISGRLFARSDVAGAQPVAIVNESMAETFWPGGSAIGNTIKLGGWPDSPNPQMTIVGIVGDVLQSGMDGERVPQIFAPRQQAGANYGGLATRFATLVVRSQTEPPVTMRAVRNVIRELDPNLPVANMRSMEEIVARSLSDQRFLSLLVGVFSNLALLLGAVGIYGVMAYSVTRRTREIGLRMALGASRGSVVASVLRTALVLTGIGVVIGVGAALVSTRVVKGLVFDVSVHDPLVFVAGPLVLVAVASLAAYMPARRAANVQPMTAMRVE